MNYIDRLDRLKWNYILAEEDLDLAKTSSALYNYLLALKDINKINGILFSNYLETAHKQREEYNNAK